MGGKPVVEKKQKHSGTPEYVDTRLIQTIPEPEDKYEVYSEHLLIPDNFVYNSRHEQYDYKRYEKRKKGVSKYFYIRDYYD